MRHPAEVLDDGIQCARLQVGAGGTPEAQVNDWTDVAGGQKLFSSGPPLAHLRRKTVPGIGQGPLFQVINTIRMPEIRAEAKEAVPADGKVVQPDAAMEQMVAVRL